MISLLHLPLFLVPGLVFFALALAWRSPVGRWRLFFAGLAVALAVGLLQFLLSRANREWQWHIPPIWLEQTASAVIYGLAFWRLARLAPGKAVAAAVLAAGVEWLVATAFATGLGASGRPRPL